MSLLRFAYADPPYVGCAFMYPEHPDSHRWYTLGVVVVVAVCCADLYDRRPRRRGRGRW